LSHSIVGHHGWNIVVSDVNGDKKLDLTMRSQNNTIVVLLGNGSGSLHLPKVRPLQSEKLHSASRAGM
jgi:hypothetical protein